MTAKSKVLVVDDDDSVRSLLAGELKEESFEVATAGDGDEAIGIVDAKYEQGEKFDVILLDIKMPRVDGFEVLKYVKQKVPETMVIMVTAYADVRNAMEASRLGASDFVSKPYDLDEILTSIRRVMDGRFGDHGSEKN